MNPVTFNNVFKRFFTPKQLNVPLVYYEKRDLITQAEFTEGNSPVDYATGRWKLPFDVFRVYLKSKGGVIPAVIVHGAAGDIDCLDFPSITNDGVKVFSCVIVSMSIEAPNLKKGEWIFICEFWAVPATGGQNQLGSSPFSIRERVSLAGLKNGEVVSHEIDSVETDEIADKIRSVGSIMLLNLVSDFANPHLYLCRRHPPIPQGHTVHWVKAREHYILIHKSHPANSREHLRKKLITDGPVIDRAAHSRRAHFRLLKSPRYRHKQGLKIWVRSAWIGPEEWTDRSGQIYKIVQRQ